jgi:hypothetical protein
MSFLQEFLLFFRKDQNEISFWQQAALPDGVYHQSRGSVKRKQHG